MRRTLMDAAAQLYPVDRDPFLRAVAARFTGRNLVNDEFARGLCELLHDGHFKWLQSLTRPSAA